MTQDTTRVSALHPHITLGKRLAQHLGNPTEACIINSVRKLGLPLHWCNMFLGSARRVSRTAHMHRHSTLTAHVLLTFTNSYIHASLKQHTNPNHLPNTC
jgi:hypothetical protein